MAKNVCPGCKEVILSFGDETTIRCSKCEAIFEAKNMTEDETAVDVDKE